MKNSEIVWRLTEHDDKPIKCSVIKKTEKQIKTVEFGKQGRLYERTLLINVNVFASLEEAKKVSIDRHKNNLENLERIIGLRKALIQEIEGMEDEQR